MAEPTLIVKKYGNRRLYDTERSQYITLEDLALLIKSGREVKVVDAKSNANLTKAVLLQIITEQEKDKDLLPVSFLKQMIQLGDTSVREALQRYLTLSLETFLNAQQEFEERYRNMAGNLMNPMMWLMPPFGQMPGMGQQQGPAMPQPPQPEPSPDAAVAAPPDPAAPPDTPEPPPDDHEATKEELQSLRAQMDQIQQMLSKLQK
jgi:polyhydroxyalkanoate synthesis repressor PhaR